MKSIEIGVLFPYAENYDSHYGGAIARWVHNVNKNVSPAYEFTYFAAGFDNNYEGHKVSSLYGAYCGLIKKAERKFGGNLISNFFLYYIRKFTCRDVLWASSLIHKLNKCDVVILHNRPLLSRLLRRLGYKGKIIIHMHNSFFASLEINKLAEAIKAADKILFCSNFLMDEAINRFPEIKLKSSVIYNGVHSTSHVVKNKEDRVLFAGRLIDDKGILELISGFEIFSKKYPTYTLCIAGGVNSGTSNQTSHYLKLINKKIENSSVKNRIKLLGYLEHNELIDEMLGSEIFAVPSKWKEPFGMVALEAYISGCKVIATADGGMPEILKDDGYYCVCSPESIAQQLVTASEHKNYQPDINNGFYWPRITKNFEEILAEVNHDQ